MERGGIESVFTTYEGGLRVVLRSTKGEGLRVVFTTYEWEGIESVLQSKKEE